MTIHNITYGCGHTIQVSGTIGSATIASCMAVLCDACCYESFVKDPDGLLFYCFRADHGHDNDLIMNVTARKFFSYKWVNAMLDRVLTENPDISRMYIHRHLHPQDVDTVKLPNHDNLSTAAESALDKYPELSREYSQCSTDSISSVAFPLYFKLYPEEAARYLSDTTFRGALARELLTPNH